MKNFFSLPNKHRGAEGGLAGQKMLYFQRIEVDTSNQCFQRLVLLTPFACPIIKIDSIKYTCLLLKDCLWNFDKHCSVIYLNVFICVCTCIFITAFKFNYRDAH